MARVPSGPNCCPGSTPCKTSGLRLWKNLSRADPGMYDARLLQQLVPPAARPDLPQAQSKLPGPPKNSTTSKSLGSATGCCNSSASSAPAAAGGRSAEAENTVAGIACGHAYFLVQFIKMSHALQERASHRQCNLAWSKISTTEVAMRTYTKINLPKTDFPPAMRLI